MVARLCELADAMRVQGSRVGVGELLAATRSLAAMDCASREDARLALAGACSQRIDLERFELAFLSVFGDGRHGPRQPLSELGAIERAALPQHGDADPGQAGRARAVPVPAAWSEIELLREKDFSRYTPAEMVAARELMARLARRHPVCSPAHPALAAARAHARPAPHRPSVAANRG